MVGTASEVVGVTLETKPRRKNKRNVLFDMTPSYKDGLVSAGGTGLAIGTTGRLTRGVPVPTRVLFPLVSGPGLLAGPQRP